MNNEKQLINLGDMGMFKKIKHIMKSIIYKLFSANKVAELEGVHYGNNCKFMTKNFGSEPYLIHIGNNFATSSGVTFVTHDGSVHVLRNIFDDMKNIDLFDPIYIGNNVFIGINATILPGSKIGNNVIVGAGSVVKGVLKSDSVYAGVPVKYICSIAEYTKKNKQYFDYTKHMSSAEKKRFLHKKYGEAEYEVK